MRATRTTTTAVDTLSNEQQQVRVLVAHPHDDRAAHAAVGTARRSASAASVAAATAVAAARVSRGVVSSSTSRAIATVAATTTIAAASATRDQIDEAVITDRASIADRLASAVVGDARAAQRDGPALVDERHLDAPGVRAAFGGARVPAGLSVRARACTVCAAEAVATSRACAPAHIDGDEHVARRGLVVLWLRLPVHARSVLALAGLTRTDERSASRAGARHDVIDATLARALLHAQLQAVEGQSVTDTLASLVPTEVPMSSNDNWRDGQYDALAKISPELRAQLAKWAPKGPSGRRAGVFSRSSELSQLSVPSEHFGPRLA